ncbi:hypothetical protein SK128_001921 [Halocaridina rubra]|uniref:Transmembrane protein n=1 Tax=Halocaridina rubra TaxID=373956 RepID=A0AAN8WIT6_HALRR
MNRPTLLFRVLEWGVCTVSFILAFVCVTVFLFFHDVLHQPFIVPLIIAVFGDVILVVILMNWRKKTGMDTGHDLESGREDCEKHKELLLKTPPEEPDKMTVILKPSNTSFNASYFGFPAPPPSYEEVLKLTECLTEK